MSARCSVWAGWKWTLAVAVAGLFFVAMAGAETVDSLAKPTGYVSDFANVFDAASQQQMEALCAEIDKKAHAQIAIVTVNDTGGADPMQFTHDLQQKWGVGTKPDNRGIVMLFAIKTHKRWIEVGYGLEGILNDAKVGDIGRTMVPQLEAGEYGPAALNGAQQIADVIAKDANVTLDAPVVHTYHREASQSSRSGGRGIGFGTIIFIAILIFLFSRGGRGGRGGGGGGWLWFLLGSMMGGGGRGYGGGSFGGGDSGGGDSGGFGGFGGGDSGGGGAGGDW